MVSIDSIRKKLVIGEPFRQVVATEDLSESFYTILCNIVHGRDIFLYDKRDEIIEKIAINFDSIDLTEVIAKSKSKIYLKTSGTTGEPKKVEHTVPTLIQGVKADERLQNITWGFCYSTRHISGLFMILQALMTTSALVDLRNKSRADVELIIRDSAMTHISAPATFYRMNFPTKHPNMNLRKISNGGEPMDLGVVQKLRESFPNAQIRNIYASTEFGSLLIAKGEEFTIPERLSETVRIDKNRIWVHGSKVASSAELVDGWYDTKDKIEWISSNSFRIVGRVSEDVKVLGHLVSIRKIEKHLYNIDGIELVKVTSRFHDVFGNLLVAEILLRTNVELSKKEIKLELKRNLRDYEIPTKIIIVDKIALTKSGKIGRT